MSEDWAAVAKCINDRVRELGWRQRELADRSQVSQAIVRELQHHTVERRRSARTLEALSLALGLRPDHLSDVLRGRYPHDGDDAEAGPMGSRMDSVELRLAEIAERLDDIQVRLNDMFSRQREQ
ncbi:helix-turn-helix transcriptional regulator [Actinokineospora auranticolor]|uniref:Helix-turn-helix protein n=1 Tax=Actinokineospora auranticolor TaxID=155976 RepID=A0A2S6GRK9_9PSEU|nr:helix-turn-helix transcriptional regulator [Actinokineospora auranticolor]PPK67864.1 hypothetical protein CLV40_10694 [Actinokineospora auranticolor]